MRVRSLTVHVPGKPRKFEGKNLVIKVEGQLVVSVDVQNERSAFHGFPFEVEYDISDEKPAALKLPIPKLGKP